jgi:hypothetical protein
VGPILIFMPEPLPDKPPMSCLVAAWLVKTANPVRIATAAILDMADDGLVTVHADEGGYTLRARLDRDSAQWRQLGRGRQAILDGLLRGETAVALPRPRDDPGDDGKMKGSLLSFDALITAVAREGESTGMASRAGWLMLAAGAAGLGGAIACFITGVPVAGITLAIGTGLLGTGWTQRKTQPSRKGRAMRARLLALREVLAAEAAPSSPGAPAPPSWHLAWSLLLLSSLQFDWWLREHARDTPAWWTWADGFAPAPAFASYSGIFGFITAIRYSMHR